MEPTEANTQRHAFYKVLIALGKQRLAQEAERKTEMETITVTIGSVQSSSSGTAILDTTRDVEFQGERLAEYREPGTGRDGNPTDTRGTTETLYRASDGRLIVHVHDWSHWQGEPTTYTLREVTEADLAGNGRFAALGLVAGYGRPLSLDEALQRGEYGESEPPGQILREYKPQKGPTYVTVNIEEKPQETFMVDVTPREVTPDD